MTTHSPINILDSDKDTEYGELFADGLAVELWVEVGPVVDGVVGPVVDVEVGPAVDGEVGLLADEVVFFVVDEVVLLVADAILEDGLTVVGPAAPY